jgi:formylglycine-generating enzyme required for sulfatase activity
VAIREYLQFMEEGGYERKELWLKEGWEFLKQGSHVNPLYWIYEEGGWYHYTLNGIVPLNLSEPISHLTFFEACAFAKWANARLPTEFEWEVACSYRAEEKRNFFDLDVLHPLPSNIKSGKRSGEIKQLLGDVWEWTISPYLPYPGQVEESIQKERDYFSHGLMVLRGGSCLSDEKYFRETNRLASPMHSAVVCNGIRLAKDL